MEEISIELCLTGTNVESSQHFQLEVKSADPYCVTAPSHCFAFRAVLQQSDSRAGLTFSVYHLGSTSSILFLFLQILPLAHSSEGHSGGELASGMQLTCHGYVPHFLGPSFWFSGLLVVFRVWLG